MNITVAEQKSDTRGASTGSATAIDNAIVSFGEGEQLGKFRFGRQSANLYIPRGGKEYAIASVGRDGVHTVSTEMPLNFKANENGTYTLTVKPEGVEMDYLHLIDNMTGVDVDLLAGNGGDAMPCVSTYTYTAKTTDYESRFRLVFATDSSANDDTFGFVNAIGNLTILGIEGEATLQIIDVTGRMLSSETFSGRYEKKLNVASGVYVLRLINGKDVKTQKIVVR